MVCKLEGCRSFLVSRPLKAHHHSNLQSTGLAFIPMGIGMILATLTQVFWVKRIRNEAALNGGKAPPESRLPVGMAGAILVPLGLLWFSLCSFSQMPWIMPLFGTVLFGCGVSE